MPDVRHNFDAEEIMAYLDGELPAARAAEAMTHLEGCAECQALAAGLRRVSRELAAWEVEAPRTMKLPVGEAPATVGFFHRWRIPKFALLAAAACAGLALLVFVAPHPATQHAEVARFAPAMPMSGPAAPPMAKATRAFTSTEKTLADTAEPAAPMIERTASLDLATREFDSLRTRLDAILARHHGYPADLNISTPQNSGRGLNGTLRVPAGELDATLTELRQLGHVQAESQKGEDVTKAYADLTARLANARNEEQRLGQILAERTGRLSDVLEVERELSRVRGNIEQMEAERRTTADQVALATIQFSASEEFHAKVGVTPDSTWTRLRNAAVDGYENVADSVIGVLTASIRYLPSVLLWLGLAYLAAILVMRFTKARN